MSLRGAECAAGWNWRWISLSKHQLRSGWFFCPLSAAACENHAARAPAHSVCAKVGKLGRQLIRERARAQIVANCRGILLHVCKTPPAQPDWRENLRPHRSLKSAQADEKSERTERVVRCVYAQMEFMLWAHSTSGALRRLTRSSQGCSFWLLSARNCKSPFSIDQ